MLGSLTAGCALIQFLPDSLHVELKKNPGSARSSSEVATKTGWQGCHQLQPTRAFRAVAARLYWSSPSWEKYGSENTDNVTVVYRRLAKPKDFVKNAVETRLPAW